jgi:hypothetical protein
MPREKKEEKIKTPKVEPIERFYAQYALYHFVYRIMDEETKKPKIMTNPLTGNPIYDVDGNPRVLTFMERFTTESDKMSKGFLSYAVYDPNDKSKQNEERGRVLRKLAAQENIRVFTESDHEEKTNRDAWIEKKRVRDLQDKVDNLESELKTYRQLDEQIAEIEGQ